MSSDASEKVTVIGACRCEVLMIFNCASVVHLDKAREILVPGRQGVPWEVLPDSSYTGLYDPQPIRLSDTSDPFRIGSFDSSRLVEMTVWQTGLITIKYTIEVAEQTTFETLQDLHEELSTSKLLLIDSRKRVGSLLTLLGDTAEEIVEEPKIEDYLIFVLESHGEAKEFLNANRPAIAGLLRGANPENPLSDDGIDDALQYFHAPRRHTLAVVDWNAALVCGPNTANERELLEFVQMQLLELRHLRAKLGRELDEAGRLFDRLQKEQERVNQEKRSKLRFWYLCKRAVLSSLQQVGLVHHEVGGLDESLFRLGMLVVDAQECIENVTHAIDLVGDPILVKLHELAKQRFGLDKLGETVSEQLAKLNNIHEKLTGRHHASQGLFWELVVVILITIEVVKAFFEH